MSADTMADGVLAAPVLVPLALLLRAPAAAFFHGHDICVPAPTLPETLRRSHVYVVSLLACLGNPVSAVAARRGDRPAPRVMSFRHGGLLGSRR